MPNHHVMNTTSASKRTGLGHLLIRDGLLTPEQLENALTEQKETHERLGEILCRRGIVTPDQLADALARQLGHGRFDPSRDMVDPAALDLVPSDVAERMNLLPIRLEDVALVVAIADPLDVEAIDYLRKIADREERLLTLLLATSEVIGHARETQYARAQGSRSVNQLIDKAVGEIASYSVNEDDIDSEEVRRHAQDAGIVRLVDQYRVVLR